MQKNKLEPIVLDGKYVRLEPLSKTHLAGLCKAISDGELWNLKVTLVPHPDDVLQFIENAHSEFLNGNELIFATIEKSSNIIAGSTRFMNVNLPNKRAEIGFTFLGQSWQRTGMNTEAKFLMLSYAFEKLQLNRVEFLTDVLNDKSRQAIRRLGAKEEGTLRHHMVMRDGRVRDSVLYSIVVDEWPRVKEFLSHKIR